VRLFPHALRRRGHYAPSLAALVGVVALAAILLGPLAPQAQPLPVASTPSAVQTSGSPLPLLLDGGQLSITSLPQVSLVTDSVQALSSTLGTRSYSVAVHVSLPLPLINLDVRTTPISVWAWPSQMPEGPVALPPLSLWTWTVTSNSRSDTTNWTLAAAGQDLQRTIPVANETFVVTGTASLTVPVTVTPNSYEPYSPPTVGFVLNAAANYGAPMFPANNPEYSQLAAQLRPTVVRIDLTDLNASGSWDTATRLPKFNFTQFDLAFKWAASIHAPVLLTLSAGTWGDGNLLPTGMPLDLSLPVTKGSTSGYFPTGAAYQSYVRAIVHHVLAANETVAYWGIGNELPLTNASVVSAFIGVFNVAAKTIHKLDPSGLIGTDVMMNKTYLPTFAQFSDDVGYLSFHFYPSLGVCEENGTYCPPKGPGNGTVDSRLWMPFAGINDQGFYAPEQAQAAWYNVTKKHVPVLDTESNLNGFGGGPLSVNLGTDPRQQNLFGAAWTISTLIDGARDNLSELTYFTFNGGTQVPNTVTGPFGGWGYGMTAQGSHGTDVRYAPYWALHMWSQSIPRDGRAVQVVASIPGILNVYAVRDNNQVTLVAVNQVDVPVTVQLDVNGTGWTGVWAHTLDGSSYVEKFNTTTQTEHLVKSTVRTTKLGKLAGPWNVAIQGYGITTVRLLRTPAHAPAEGSVAGAEATFAAPSPLGAGTAVHTTSPVLLASAPEGTPVASARWV
jgi:hypothetical protein